MVQSQFNREHLPRYIIVNQNLKVDVLRTHLGFTDNNEMLNGLESVHVVKPNWALHLIEASKSSKAKPHSQSSSASLHRMVDQDPTMDQCWGKLQVLRERKKRNFEEVDISMTPSPLQPTQWMKKRRQTHEFAPEVRVPASRSEIEMIRRLYKLKNGGILNYGGAPDEQNRIHGEDMMKTSMMGVRAQEGRVCSTFQGRNVELSRLFETLSKLFKEMPIDPHDSWRCYTYKLIAGRLRYLDFEVEYNEDCLKKLSKVKHFGRKCMLHVSDHFAHSMVSYDVAI